MTEFDWVTAGWADLKQPLVRGLRELAAQMRDRSVVEYDQSGRICVPWDRDHMASAAKLAAAYYKLLDSLGLYEPYRWHRRPASA